MEISQKIERALKRLGIDDNMILTDTMNISTQFIVNHYALERDELERIDGVKITITFEAKMI